MTKICVPLCLSLFVSVASAWEMSDVSVLIPLPAKLADGSKLLGVGTAGAKGVLLPKNVTSRLPKLVTTQDREKTLEATKVVALRFDPCFHEGHGAIVCHHQIRMVWQPVIAFKGKTSTKDATMHSFYEFDDAEWNTVLAEYAGLLAANPFPATTTLQVNPRIKAQGLGGAFWQGLRSLLLKHCGESNLVRATIMTLEPGENDWRFLGFDIRGSALKPILISNVGQPEQRVKSVATPANEMKSTIEPELVASTSNAVFGDSAKAAKSLSDHELREFGEEIRRVEDPARSNPGTVDCATCHLSGPAGAWLRGTYPQWDWSLATASRTGARDLRNVTIGAQQPRRLRGFGYFYADPLFSQRLVNETAAVADTLDRTHPLK